MPLDPEVDQHLRAWKCDRCDADDEWPENFWPKGWTLHQLGMDKLGEVVLCIECTAELSSWWRLPTQVLELQRDGSISSEEG